MATLDVIVSSPFPTDSLQGNSISARRIASRIAAPGLAVQAVHGYADQDARILVALHARRSLPAIRAFRARYPLRPIILVATGTDLYQDLPAGRPEPLEAMRLADAIVTYQSASVQDVPGAYRHKVTTILKSVELPVPARLPPPPRTPITFTILAHLREAKDPFLPAAALASLSSLPELRLEHFGTALDPDLRASAEAWMRREPRYHWSEQRPRDEIAAIISSSHATINSGRSEGGSNAVGESILLGTPVLATAIPANIGFLGKNYAGFYRAGDIPALAALLDACRRPDSPLLETLRSQLRERASLFSASAETAGWIALLDSLAARI